jgi:hypothetical protein
LQGDNDSDNGAVRPYEVLTAYCDEVEPDGAMGMHEGALGDLNAWCEF